MKNFLRLSLIALGFLGLTQSMESQTISPHYFGVNAWMADTIGDVNNCAEPPCYKNGKLHKQWEKIKDSKASIVRYGGISPDQNKPTNFQYLRVIDSIRAKGMEPVMQVSFWNYRYTAAEAKALVHYINVIKGRNVKYWIIANEPNLMYNYTTAAQVAAYFKPFASAMKSADPSILIVGPETASFKKVIIDGLTTPGGPDDITGKDAAGRYYVDVISFHTYPMQDGLGTRAEAIAKLTSANNLQDNLAYLNTRINSCNSYHNRTGSASLKTAVTETNVNYNNGPSDNLYGVGANSFFGGQFVCEIYGIGLKHGVDFINLWSVMEGGSDVVNNGGFLDGVTGNKKPLYYHFQMMAGAFKGTSVNATTNNGNVKSFACKNGSETTVMILNEDLTNNFNYRVRLNTAAVSGTDPLKINVNAGIASEYNAVIPNQSTLLLTFNSAGSLIKKTEYSLQNHAVSNLPPTTTLITPVVAVCNVPSGMNTTLITAGSATINWNSTGALSYNVRYKPVTSTTWTTANVTGTSRALTGLAAGTNYEFQVSGVCSSTSSSTYSVSSNFNTPAAVCNIPAGLNTASITSVGATLSWASTGITNYNVRYKALSATTWVSSNVTGTSTAISGLAAGTSYEFQVRAVCSSTLSSAFSVSKTFVTAAGTCNVPAGLTAIAITANSATLNWTSTGAGSYNLRYKTAAATTWTTTNVAALSKVISGLAPSTAYVFQVSGVCSSTLASAYSVSKSFTTTSACSVPAGLSVNTIEANTAILNWASTGATSYNVRYKTAASAYWTTKTTTALTQKIYGLTPGTAYEFQVMGVCSSTSSSVYSASKPFTTSSGCNTPAGLSSNMITSNSANLTWTSNGSSGYNVRYKALASSTWITSTTTANSKAITGLIPSTMYEFQVSAICSGASSAYSVSAQFATTASNTIVVIGKNNANTTLTPYAASAVKEHVQMIISKAELIAAGYNATNNKLQSLSFYMGGTSQLVGNFTIKIMHISGSSFSNNKFISTVGSSTVYAANHTTAATGWNQHTFSTPFIYNGTGNILIDISWSNTSVKTNAPVKYTATSSYRTLYYKTGSTSVSLANIAQGTLTYERPNMKLEFSGGTRSMEETIAEEEPAPETETIAKVTELDMNVYPNPVSTDFNISFNVNSGETAKVTIFNIIGDLVEEIEHTAETTGKQKISFDFNSDIKLSSLASGTYICCIDANGKRTSKKFILVK